MHACIMHGAMASSAWIQQCLWPLWASEALTQGRHGCKNQLVRTFQFHLTVPQNSSHDSSWAQFVPDKEEVT